MQDVWIQKYAPKDPSEMVGQNKAINRIVEFTNNYKSEKKKGLLLYGGSGSGKTCSVHSLANDFEILEVNASDFRSKKLIEEHLGNAMGQMSLFAKSKIVLVDEIDGMSGTKDRGGLKAVENLMKKSAFPIILTVKDPWDKKFSGVRKICELVEFKTLQYVSIFNHLKHIAEKEEIKYDEVALKTLARRVGGDLRAAINDFQMLAGMNKTFTKEDVEIIGDRERKESIHQALFKIFKTTDPEVARHALDTVNEDVDQIMLWIDHNLPREYTKPEDLERAYNSISKASVFKGRIMRRQHWRYLVYVFAHLSMGVAVAKDEKYKSFIKYEQTKRILMLWQAKMKYGKREGISEKIARAMHTSKKRVIKDIYPFFKRIFMTDPFFKADMTEKLELSKDEVNYLLK